MANILLVDDDQDLIEMNKTMLAQRGHTVLVAYSAAEALQLFQANRPDAAVVDVMMENLSAGFDLARHLHAQMPELPNDHAHGHPEGNAASLQVRARRDMAAGHQGPGEARESARARGRGGEAARRKEVGRRGSFSQRG